MPHHQSDYVMQRKIYILCMNNDMQGKKYNLYKHELCIIALSIVGLCVVNIGHTFLTKPLKI